MVLDFRRVIARRIYYGWVIVVACLLASFVVFGTTYTFSVFADEFVHEFDVSTATVAVIFGIQTALIYVAAVGAAQAVSRYGQRLTAAISGVVMGSG